MQEREIIETQDKIEEEIRKCNESPYYFATKYLVVKDHLGKPRKFKTPLTEEEFNNLFNQKNNDLLYI